MLKGCVIGLGVMGSNHVRVLHELQEEGKVLVVGVADINEKQAKNVAERYEMDWFTDYKRLLQKKPDFAVVAVPTEVHHNVAMDVIKKGCHLLVEKPIAYTVKEAGEIVEAAKKNAVQLMVGHTERFNPAIQEIKERTRGERILLIGAVRVGPTPPLQRMNTGVVIDLAVHDIDLIRYLTNSEFRRINAFMSNDESRMEKSAVLSFEMETGALAYIITNIITPLKRRKVEVTTATRFILGDLISHKVTEYSGGKLITHARRSSFVTEIDIPYMEPLKLELKAFLDSLEKTKEPPVTGEDGLKALEIAIKCVQHLSGGYEKG